MRIDNTLENELYNSGIYEAWQFVVNTVTTLSTAQYCKDTILRLLASMQSEHEAWKEKLWDDLMAQDGKVKQIAIKTDSLPDFRTPIAGEKISTNFLLSKLTKDFFQYSRNVFDSISQIANVALLGSKAKKPDSVDFPAMLKTFNQATYSQDFPNIVAWYNSISIDPAFQYIDAFNNRTKHTCDVYLKVSMDLLGNHHSSDINPFFRKEVQHNKKNIGDYLNQILSFTQQSFDSFMDELAKEYPKKLYLSDRYNKLKCWQQKNDKNPDGDFAVVYIETSADDMSALPEHINVLLLNRCDDGTIYGKNCSIDTILVKKAGSDWGYIGRYIAAEPCADDTLLRYRKYDKDVVLGMPALFQTQHEWAAAPTFYKANPYISITTVSDNEDFLKRVQLPF